MYIAILEDDERRVASMRSVLASLASGHETRFFDSAHAMIAWLRDHLDRVVLISLDHDLLPPLDEAEAPRPPGCGQDVVDYLRGQPPRCPVILHTSNVLAAPLMEEPLALAGWDVKRVVPFFDLEWIGSAWGVAVEIRLARAPAARPAGPGRD